MTDDARDLLAKLDELTDLAAALAEAIANILNLARTLLGVDTALIAWAADGVWRIEHAANDGSAFVGWNLPVAAAVFQRIATMRLPVVVTDGVTAASLGIAAPAGQPAIGAFAGVPLMRSWWKVGRSRASSARSTPSPVRCQRRRSRRRGCWRGWPPSSWSRKRCARAFGPGRSSSGRCSRQRSTAWRSRATMLLRGR